MNLFSFFLPHFLGELKSKTPLLPRRVAALSEGPVLFGRNRENRSREAAGRRNWPAAVPRKVSRRKRGDLPGSVRIGVKSRFGARNAADYS
jgi:hypothetical protein